MPTLYVAGPVPDRRLLHDEFTEARNLYGTIDTWCRIRGVEALIPTDSPAFRALTPNLFNARIRSLIDRSTHVLVVPHADSIATGIEAEYAHQLEKPIALCYHASLASRMLSAIAVTEQERGESVESLLLRFVGTLGTANRL